MMWNGGGGHVGGSLSAADIIAALYFHIMSVDPNRPNWDDRDRFVMSKGHAAATLYAALAEKGFFPVERLFDSFRNKADGILQEHPDIKIPGVDMSSGSLGQGLSVAVGMALAGRLMKKDFRVFVMLGDGEIGEGQVWEAAMSASHYELGRITAILDYNKLSVEGRACDLCQHHLECPYHPRFLCPHTFVGLEPVVDKWRAFNWLVQEIDGHNMDQIIGALEGASKKRCKPLIIIAHTVKGKGVSFMENNPEWHSKQMTEEQMKKALAELKTS